MADDYVLASSAYGTGGGLVKVTAEGDAQAAEEKWFEKSFANHHGGLVKVDDHVYGFGSNSLFCVNFLTGEIAWQEKSVGKGSLVYANGQLYCLASVTKWLSSKRRPRRISKRDDSRSNRRDARVGPIRSWPMDVFTSAISTR